MTGLRQLPPVAAVIESAPGWHVAVAEDAPRGSFIRVLRVTRWGFAVDGRGLAPLDPRTDEATFLVYVKLFPPGSGTVEEMGAAALRQVARAMEVITQYKKGGPRG